MTIEETGDEYDSFMVQSAKERDEGRQFLEDFYEHNEALLQTGIYDVAQAQQELDANDTPYARRAFVRVLFSTIEAILFTKQRVILGLVNRDWDRVRSSSKEKMFNPGSARFTLGDLVALSEVDYSIDVTGKVKQRPIYAPFLGRVRLILDSERRFWGNPNSIDYSGVGWLRFQEAQQVRNRLMHPKSASDLEVSDKDLAAVRAGRDWFVNAAYHGPSSS